MAGWLLKKGAVGLKRLGDARPTKNTNKKQENMFSADQLDR
jgi:hypothetical protein